MSRADRIQQVLTSALSPTVLQIENESDNHSGPKGRETHFKILVVSEKFLGQSRIDRQRFVNQILASEFNNGLHALAQRLLTPPEWQSQSGAFESPDCKGGSKN